jgi:hypothetical protein
MLERPVKGRRHANLLRRRRDVEQRAVDIEEDGHVIQIRVRNAHRDGRFVCDVGFHFRGLGRSVRASGWEMIFHIPPQAAFNRMRRRNW